MSSGITRRPVIANMPDCPVAELPARTPAEQAQWRAVFGLGTAAAADVSAFDPAGAALAAGAATPADLGTLTIPTGSIRVQYTRLIMTSVNRLTLQGTARIALTDFGEQKVTYLGTPKIPRRPFTVPTENQLTINNRLTLTGTMRVTLEGTATLILSDDFGSRSRIVLSGRSG